MARVQKQSRFMLFESMNAVIRGHLLINQIINYYAKLLYYFPKVRKATKMYQSINKIYVIIFFKFNIINFLRNIYLDCGTFSTSKPQDRPNNVQHTKCNVKNKISMFFIFLIFLEQSPHTQQQLKVI